MPGRGFAIEKGGPKRLQVSWKMGWKDTELVLDGAPVGTVPSQAELKQGRSFRLGDGSELTVRLGRQFLSPSLQLSRDGRPLPGSGADPETRLGLSYGIIFFVAGLNIVLGAVAVAGNVAMLKNLGLGYVTIGFGLVYLVLGYFVRRRSMVALAVAVGLFAVDSLLTVAAGAVGALVARVFFLAAMATGFGAISDLKKAQRGDEVRPVPPQQ